MSAAEQLPAGLPIAVRVGTADDVPFVMDSWLMSEREAVGHTEGRLFARWQRRMQRDILGRHTTELRVATPDDEPSTILGWLVCGRSVPSTVYYLFTRFHSRRLGIARLLLGGLASQPEVIYGARPARVFDEAARAWVSSPVAARIPHSWRHLPRVNFFEP